MNTVRLERKSNNIQLDTISIISPFGEEIRKDAQQTETRNRENCNVWLLLTNVEAENHWQKMVSSLDM